MDKHISYLVFESYQARLERANFRLWIVCIILTIMLFVSNAGWICYEMQWQTVEETEVSQEIDTDDGTVKNIVGVGNINGESEADG